MSSSAVSGSNFSIITTVPPNCWTPRQKRSGAAWYTGAGLRYTFSSSKPKSSLPSIATEVSVAERDARQWGLDALRQTGRARAVEHVDAVDAVGQGLGGLGGDRVLVGLVALDDAVDHEAGLHLRGVGHDRGRQVAEVGAADEHAGAAVVDDVRQLFASEPTRGERVDETGVPGAPGHGQRQRVVLEADGDVIARLQAQRPEQLGEAVGTLVELGVGDPLAGAGHDRRRSVRSGLGEVTGEHPGDRSHWMA